jgi:hypothetical protein
MRGDTRLRGFWGHYRSVRLRGVMMGISPGKYRRVGRWFEWECVWAYIPSGSRPLWARSHHLMARNGFEDSVPPAIREYVMV